MNYYNDNDQKMKPMKVETCPPCGARREVPVTCRHCASMLMIIDLPFRWSCRFGLTGKRLCWRFQKRPGVEIVKQGDKQ